ncbi:unnamed protein product [Zymoseptoria tritici ST99CH_1E4]|uniref:F-box domain-containing protein n=1 Tax=Zymoseptoria tritici ST99CH_1E4 TaxID=1276532 RepID=A0A2H1GCR2_ZYMTR|nr:unnamed protein product [Zymoseptoria tritici ST99CH_1E4]
MEDKQSSLVSEPPLSYVATAHPEAQPFRLFDLPDELWVRIGKMVIGDTPAMRVSKVTIRPALEPRSRNKSSSKGHGIDLNPPAILQTCSALRRELRAEYYRHNVTLVTSVYDDYKDGLQSLSATDKLGRWLLMIGPEARREVRGICHDDFARRKFATLTAPGFGALKWGMGRWEFETILTLKRFPAPESETFDWVDWEIKFL